MAYIFVDDGFPEADEDENNYIWFDEKDPQNRCRALDEANRRRRRHRNPTSEAAWGHVLGIGAGAGHDETRPNKQRLEHRNGRTCSMGRGDNPAPLSYTNYMKYRQILRPQPWWKAQIASLVQSSSVKHGTHNGLEAKSLSGAASQTNAASCVTAAGAFAAACPLV